MKDAPNIKNLNKIKCYSPLYERSWEASGLELVRWFCEPQDPGSLSLCLTIFSSDSHPCLIIAGAYCMSGRKREKVGKGKEWNCRLSHPP